MIACVEQLNRGLPTATRCFGKSDLTQRAGFWDGTDLFDEHCLCICAITWSLNLGETHASQIPCLHIAKYSANSQVFCNRIISGDRSGISQSCLSMKKIKSFTPQYIWFPHTANQQIDFFFFAIVPNLIGAVACTLTQIKEPSLDPLPFLNWKLHHSINVQIIPDETD